MTWTDRSVSGLRGWKRFTREVEGVLTDNIAATVPWLAPVIPAWIAWDGMTAELHFSRILAFIGAIVVEFLGFSAITTTIQFWEYNESKRKSDQKAPVLLAVIAVVFYLSAVLTVNVLLDPSGVIVKVAKGLLSSLSLVGAVILALRSQHSRRLVSIETEKAERKEERKERHVLAMLPESSGKLPESGDWRNLPDDDKILIAGMTTAQIVQRYSVSDRTARNWRENARAKKN